MATYVLLAKFTDQGIRNVKDTVKRAEAFKAAAKKQNVTVKEFVWTLGTYDCVLLVEAPDDETMTAVCLGVGMMGNVQTQTMRAFTSSDMKSILGKMG
jgi:uncharacterized protein with GYD domain